MHELTKRVFGSLHRSARIAIGRYPGRLPDFFVVGAVRSGTSYLHHLLKQHSHIFMPEVKELQFFNSRDFHRGLNYYKKQFVAYAGEELIGEVSPNYMSLDKPSPRDRRRGFDFEESAIRRIAGCVPKAKIIISLRNPLERLNSMYGKSVLQGKYSFPLDKLLQDELSGQKSIGLIFHVLGVKPSSSRRSASA